MRSTQLAGLVGAVAILVTGLLSAPALAADNAGKSAGDREDAGVELVIGFKAGGAPAVPARSLSAAGVRAAADDPLAALHARRVTVARADSARIAAELRADPAVAYVETDSRVHVSEIVPNDPNFEQQTELPQITVPEAWEKTTGSAAVTVAVVDTGVSALRDLAGAVLPGRDFVNNDDDATDDHGHGTAAASIIAARGNDGVGMAGVCWKCRVLPVKVLDATASGSWSDVAAGIVYAADRGAQIIVLSMTATSGATVVQNAITYARNKGVVLFSTVGEQLKPNITYPAGYPGVVSVGGTGENSDIYIICFMGLCLGSNYGSNWVDIAAPTCPLALDLEGLANDTGGTDVDDDDYDTYCSIGHSAALAAGVAALVKSAHPSANAWSLTNSLFSTAVQTPTVFTRYGEIRAAAALRAVDEAAPRIAGAIPAQNTRFRGAVTVGATGVSDTGGSGIDRAALYADGKYVGQDGTAPYAVRYNSGRRSGVVRLQWRVYDRAGNSVVLNRSLIADNAVPKVTVTGGPKNAARVKGTVTVTASASDPSGVARVELLINGKVVAKDTRAAYSFKIKVSRYGKKLKVQVRAIDRVGNAATTAARSWKR